MSDQVNHPSHYTSHPSGVECITLTREMPFAAGNALKYVFRSPYKGRRVEDLQKAMFYVSLQMNNPYAMQMGKPSQVFERAAAQLLSFNQSAAETCIMRAIVEERFDAALEQLSRLLEGILKHSAAQGS